MGHIPLCAFRLDEGIDNLRRTKAVDSSAARHRRGEELRSKRQLSPRCHYGFAEGAAKDYVEMFATLDTGLLFEDIQKTRPKIQGTPIEDFAKTWAAAYG
jgi:hypothetical protein